MRKVGAAVFVIAFSGALAFACGGDDERVDAPADAGAEVPDAPPTEEAGDAPPAGPTVTVTTRAAPRGDAVGALATATWVAVDTGGGTFTPIVASADGTYTFVAPGAWSIVIACAAPDNAQSTVAIHRRSASVRALEVTLAPWCTAPLPLFESTLTGAIANVSADTTWLDFGHPLEGRGSAIVVNGTTASYELVNVANGTWDLAFGVRDVFTGPLTKVLVRRGEVITATKSLVLDAKSGVVPGSKALVVHGVDACDTLEPAMRYTMGGPSGIDVGPQDVPAGADVTLAYETLPPAVQAPHDRYRGDIACLADRDRTQRRSRIEIHDALDIDVKLLPLVDAPVARTVATAPYWRVEAKGKRLANVAVHEMAVRVEKGQRRDQRWSHSDDEPGGELAWTVPELTAVAGFDPAWGLPVDATATVTFTATEAPAKLGDGTATRTSAKTIRLDP